MHVKQFILRAKVSLEQRTNRNLNNFIINFSMYGRYRLFVWSLRIFYFVKIRYLEHPTIKGPVAPMRHSANLLR